MSFAIYGESNGYVHLVTADDRDTVVDMFMHDLREFNIDLRYVFNVYAVEGNQECKELEDYIEQRIQEARDDVQ